MPAALHYGKQVASRTWLRNQDWRDDLAMGTATIRSSPESAKADNFMAQALFESDASHANIDRVIAEAEKALAILDPLPDLRNAPDAYLRAAGYYLAKGDLPGRASWWRIAHLDQLSSFSLDAYPSLRPARLRMTADGSPKAPAGLLRLQLQRKPIACSPPHTFDWKRRQSFRGRR